MDPFLSINPSNNNEDTYSHQNTNENTNTILGLYSTEAYKSANVDFTTEETVFGSIYFAIGLIGSLMISFVLITLMKELGNKKGIYSLIKSNIWYELAILIHIFKNGIGNLIDIKNRLVCKVDSGFTFFTINMTCYYYMLLMFLMIYNKGHYPQMTRYKRMLMVFPAVIIGLVSVILLFSYDLSGESPWHTCYIKKDISVSLAILFIPQYIFLIFSIFFFAIVYMGTISLTGVMRHFNIYCLYNSIFYLVLCVSYYLGSTVLGSISFCIIGLMIIVFRMNCDIVVYSFNNGMSDNKIIHFLATLLCIDSPPVESMALDLQKEEQRVMKNILHEKKMSKMREEERMRKVTKKNELLRNSIRQDIKAQEDNETNKKNNDEQSESSGIEVKTNRNSGIN